MSSDDANMNSATYFKTAFETLTGHSPLRWQERLFHTHFVNNDLCPIIDLPTGLGKTMVMAIWLIARTVNKALPRRLVYVVDRRTVVDQATDLATSLQANVATALPSLGNLSVSTLRGQLADNREWSRDPSRPAIIIGTVDLIGSALLFSGYRSSYKRRPLEAGLFGQDSLAGVGRGAPLHGRSTNCSLCRLKETVNSRQRSRYRMTSHGKTDAASSACRRRVTIRSARSRSHCSLTPRGI